MTTESKKSPAPEQASEAVPQRPRTENPTAEAIFEQAAGAGNLISSKSGDGKSRDDALTDDQRQALGESISEYFGKLDSDEGIRAPEGRILLAFDYCDSRNVDDLIDRTIVPALAASPVEQPAAAPAVVTELASMTRMFHAACHDLGLINEALGLDPDDGGAAPILDAIAELKSRATSANETGAEGATDLRERARLAADQWANPGTSIPQRTAYRDGFIDGASSPAIAAQAVAAWLHRDDPRDCISDAKKRDMIEHAGSGGRRLAENYSIGLCRLDALPAMAAAAPADERAAFDVALAALAEYQRNWDTGLPAEYAQGERVQMECAVEAIREALEDARAAASPAASIPDGYALVPKRITAAMIESAMEHHYGKRRVRQNGGAGGIVMTVNDTDWSGIDAMRRFWKGALAAAPQPAQADAPAEAREPTRHEWDETGERCVKCGDKDWFADPHCSESRIKGGAPADAGVAVTAAARDVLAERSRQVEVEAMTPAGDDQYDRRQLALAGASYALSGAGAIASDRSAPVVWPWSHEWWKPTTPRRDLVKAGALIVAEIERLDRRPDCVRAADEACEDVQKLVDGIDAARAQGGGQK
ncbi:hypothetical protein [Burkholderia ubonensis]|uniref:hypothetical protein n=1 Tax=Burkholderia ubonensis TaxID=101571 RepID=UPI00075A0665|nr:hypothetical protein [Burkholderia ubonensis]KVU10333.1 hypothetical protein WK61_23125 [Burkholderia ubonensis]